MKIIFDSEKQREDLFKMYCPHELGLPGCDVSNCGLSVRLGDIPKVEVCRKCWEECGLEHEVKDEEESIEMTKEKEITYTDAVYELVKDECEGMDAIYEDYIVSLVGRCGLGSLKRAGLVEGCGMINCRQLYVLCDRK